MAVMTLIPNALSSRPMNTPDTDEELFRRFRSAGDEAALDRLFERNWNAAYHIALGILGDPAGAVGARSAQKNRCEYLARMNCSR